MVGGLSGCLAGKDWIPRAWYSVQDSKYIRKLAAVVAQGSDQQILRTKSPAVVGRRQLNAIRRALTDEKRTGLVLDGVRRAKVVSVSQPQPVSRSNTVRTWALHVEDGQTMFVDIQSRIPQELRQTKDSDRVSATEELRAGRDHGLGEHAKRDDRLRFLVGRGADIAGGATSPAVGTVLGSLLSEPDGVAVGGTIGAAVTMAVKAIGHDLSSRLLSPREQARVGGVYALAAAAIVRRCQNGQEVRDDGFFSPGDGSRSDAEEVWENALMNSQREPEEKKLPYIAHLLTNLAFDRNISAAMAHQIIRATDSMTYRQLCILQLCVTKEKLNLRKRSLEEQESSSKEVYQLLYEYYDLNQRGLITFGDTSVAGLKDVNPSTAALQELGVDIYDQMGLNLIPANELVPIAEQLR